MRKSPPPALATALLAGGGSRRMGTDKALLPWGASTLLQHQAKTLSEIETDKRFLSLHPEQSIPAPLGYRIVPDPNPDLGPLAGITACLKAAAPIGLLVLAVDMPLMTSAILDRLVRSETGACFLNDGRFETLAAFYPATALPIAQRRLDERQLALQGFVRELVEKGLMKVIDPHSAEAKALTNINTPEELARHSPTI